MYLSENNIQLDTRMSCSTESISLSLLYQSVRTATRNLCAPLEIEDYVIQTAPFMSPIRWHLGHTTWFFEMLLRTHLPGYQVFSEKFLFYFNSYYDGFGVRIDRARRGSVSRPTVREVMAYRALTDR